MLVERRTTRGFLPGACNAVHDKLFLEPIAHRVDAP